MKGIGTILPDRQVKCTTTLVSEFGIPSAVEKGAVADFRASDAAKLLNWRKDSAPIIKDVYSWRKHPCLV